MDTLDDIKRLIETPGFEKLEIGPRDPREGLEEYLADRDLADRVATLTINGKQKKAFFCLDVGGNALREAIHVLVGEYVG